VPWLDYLLVSWLNKVKKKPSSMEIELVKKMDLSKVDPDDRPGVKTVIHRILTFDEDIMPDLTLDINTTHEHYNMTFKGWNMPISMRKMHAMFLDETTRSSKYDIVIDIDMIPANNLLAFKIRRSNFQKIKRKNK